MTFTISLVGCMLVSPNSRMNRWTKARFTRDLRHLAKMIGISERNRQNLPPADAPKRLLLVLIRGPGQKLYDDDNLAGACKALRDGIVDAGWLVNDSPQWCTATYGQERGPVPLLRVSVT